MGALTPVVLAVDGGGSKTDVVAIDLDGEVVAHERGPGSNPQSRGWERTAPLLDGLRHRVLAQVADRRVLTTHVYLAGMDFPEEIDAAKTALAHWTLDGAAADVIDNDLFALLRAGTLALDAVAVVCGTGINAIGVRSDGVTARFPAIGDLSGDWGGGAFLGNRALWHAARAEDGRGPQTALRQAVPAAFDLPDVRSVTRAFHFGEIAGNAINSLSPVLFDVASTGDSVAQSVIHRQGKEIVLLARAAVRRLELEQHALGPIPVVLGGGVLAAKHPLLADIVTVLLDADIPTATPIWVTSPPILGAGLSALEAVGAPAQALEQYRNHSVFSGRGVTHQH